MIIDFFSFNLSLQKSYLLCYEVWFYGTWPLLILISNIIQVLKNGPFLLKIFPGPEIVLVQLPVSL